MDIGKRLFKLINNEIVFGSAEVMENPESKGEILIKQPFQAKTGDIMPYCVQDLGSAPGAIQIHSMNVLWSVPLSEFPIVETAYLKAVTGIVTENKPKIII